MAGQGNAPPVIIKKKKKVIAGGHHGGAWKVAYADFVTAMMAFFLLMWLLNATTEKQRKGLSDYFNPTIPISRVSAGGEGVLGGDSSFSTESQARDGSGGTGEDAGQIAANKAAEEAALEDLRVEIQAGLFDKGRADPEVEKALRNVNLKITDEGLAIELQDRADSQIFIGETAEPHPITRLLIDEIAAALERSKHGIAINGHVRSYPVMLKANPIWELSSDRAEATRRMLTDSGMAGSRIQRVVGMADRKPAASDPIAIENNRIEIVVLRGRIRG